MVNMLLSPTSVFGLICLYLAAVVPSSSLATEQEERHLVQAHVLFRHGDRTPTNTYPNSAYQEDSWYPEGFDQMTTLGIQMQYKLGTYLRKRYRTLIDVVNYNRKETYVRSTDRDRALISAQATLAGLFPPNEDQIWNSSIQWQPIPVHTIPVKQDFIMRVSPEGSPCPKFLRLQKETLRTNPEYLALNKKYSDFLEIMSLAAGFDWIMVLDDVWRLYDPLNVERINGFPLPSWACVPGVMDLLQYLSDRSMTFLYETKEKSRLRGGPLLGHMIEKMVNSISPETKPGQTPTLFLYSSHETTMTAFLCALGLYDGKTTPLSSYISLELYKEQTSYSVEMRFHEDTQSETSTPRVLTLKHCQDPCPLEEYIALTKDMIPKDIYEECQLENPCDLLVI